MIFSAINYFLATYLCFDDGSPVVRISRHFLDSRDHIEVTGDNGRHGVTGETEKQLLPPGYSDSGKGGGLTGRYTVRSCYGDRYKELILGGIDTVNIL